MREQREVKAVPKFNITTVKSFSDLSQIRATNWFERYFLKSIKISLAWAAREAPSPVICFHKTMNPFFKLSIQANLVQNQKLSFGELGERIAEPRSSRDKLMNRQIQKL